MRIKAILGIVVWSFWASTTNGVEIDCNKIKVITLGIFCDNKFAKILSDANLKMDEFAKVIMTNVQQYLLGLGGVNLRVKVVNLSTMDFGSSGTAGTVNATKYLETFCTVQKALPV